jgi:GWxTD domain-containing protein
MKTFLFNILVFCSLIAQSQIEALLDIKKFHSTESDYIETYLYVFGNTLYESSDTNNTEKGIEVLQYIENQNKQIISHKKYIIKEVSDYVEKEGIIDLQRFPISDGEYTLFIEIIDINNPSNIEKHQEKFTMNYTNFPCFSDIELLDSYWKASEENELTKSGYHMIPLVSNYFGPEFDKLAYYFEIYNSPSDSLGMLLLKQSIKIKSTQKIAGQYNKIKKVPTEAIYPVINTFDLNNLPTGNYELSIELINQKNRVIFKSTIDFQRTNLNNSMQLDRLNAVLINHTFVSSISSDSISDFINCLSPIASRMESNIIDKKSENINDTLKRQFLYSFWYNRQPDNPELAWQKYKAEIDKADQLFSTKVRRGYQTDMGRIFLKYGPPNTITDRPNEPSAYPYQVWHYYKIGKFNNKRFIFYKPDLGTNEYVTLHSTLQGEYFNRNWKTDLHRRNTPGRSVDNLQNPNDGQWGSNSNIFFTNP